jgi:hypothetical protein
MESYYCFLPLRSRLVTGKVPEMCSLIKNQTMDYVHFHHKEFGTEDGHIWNWEMIHLF